MAVPVPANLTCDIYIGGSGPPAAPRIAAVSCSLRSAWREGMESGENFPAQVMFTHIMLVDRSVDVRDATEAYGGSVIFANCDRVYVPDQNGTRFFVIWVERIGSGSSGDHKRVYLQRDNGVNLTWPNQYL